MPRVVFTRTLERYVSCPPRDVRSGSVGEVLGSVFSENPELRGYVLDDQGRLRRHVVVFVDGKLVEDRIGLSDEVGDHAEVFVMQALSGG